MKRKFLSLLLISAVMIGLLGACGSGDSGRAPAAEPDAGEAVSDAGVFPIVNDKLTLKVMIGANPAVEDFNTNEFTKYFEEKTNIHVEWEIATAEKLNLALASGDLPDVIMSMNVTPEQQALYGEQGVILPLNDYIEKYGLNTKKCLRKVLWSNRRSLRPTGTFTPCRLRTNATTVPCDRSCGSTNRG